MSVDMGSYIAPKSDQLNADDLIAGPRTITVTGVRATEGSAEQPVSISFEGDGGKPYIPCKSMRRVMVSIWGTNAATYVGRSMTLYRDEAVQFGGIKVGGIRISHMSHIDAPQTIALTATRARRAPYTVQPLQREPAAAVTTTTSTSKGEQLEKRAMAALDEAFKNGGAALTEAWKKITDTYASRGISIPLAVDAKYGELTEALKE